MTKPLINYETFKSLDIRVGTIVSARIIEEADKLLLLSVDVGEEVPRQIVSAIREYVPDPEALVGTQTTFVCNLEPRMIRGYESNGMLFALGGGESFAFLRPDRDVSPGTIAV